MMTVPKKAENILKIFCHDQVKILLERMDTHPEEFTSKEKWDLFLPFAQDSTTISALRKHNLYRYFTKVERIAIGHKLKRIIYEKMRQEAYNGIMDTLVKSEYRDTEEMFGKAPIKAQGSTITYDSTTTTWGATNATTLLQAEHAKQKYQVEQMIEQLKQARAISK